MLSACRRNQPQEPAGEAEWMGQFRRTNLCREWQPEESSPDEYNQNYKSGSRRFQRTSPGFARFSEFCSPRISPSRRSGFARCLPVLTDLPFLRKRRANTAIGQERRGSGKGDQPQYLSCLLYLSAAVDERSSVD